jgi:hypothetical protein
MEALSQVIVSIIDKIPGFGFREIHMQWLKDLTNVIGYKNGYIM